MAGKNITISGYIDPLTTNGKFYNYWILYYANTHPSDIFYYGSLVAISKFYYSASTENENEGFTYSSTPLHLDTEFTFTDLSSLRAGHIGPLILIFEFDEDIPANSNLKLNLPRNSLYNVSKMGFGEIAQDNLTCNFVNLSDY